MQSHVLRIPALRRKLGLPVIAKGSAGYQSASMMDTYNTIRKWIQSKVEEGKMAAKAGNKNDGENTIQLKTRTRRR